MGHGRRTAYNVRISLAEMRHDIDAGLPPSAIIGRNGGSFAIVFGDHVTAYFDILRDAGLPQFRAAGREWPAEVVPVGVPTPLTVSLDPKWVTADGRPELTLPDPPPGAVAVRLRTTTVETTGRHRVTLEWTDAETGRAVTDAATAAWSEGFTVHLVFPLSGRPTGLRFAPQGVITLLRIEAVDWLVAPPP
jgi:hypothetical protein